jgi:GNAT superfamily N-acetyltransferase
VEPSLAGHTASAPPARHRGAVKALVRQLTTADRDRLVRHFTALDDDDRVLRFGQYTSDHVIENYVRGIDFKNDVVFGVFDAALKLVGVGHLAYLPAEKNAIGRTAEFGLSVLESARGTGVGSALFARAGMRCRNSGVTTLYMHCLAHNQTMMHIARKASMDIRRDYGEADAYLALPPADSSTILGEMFEEQAAAFDYALKRQARQANKLLASFLPALLPAA